MSQQRRLLFKCIVVGDGGVGKSTMIQRLTTGHFIPQKITIGTDLATYDMKFDDVMVTLQIWDFAGEKRFRFFLPSYARGSMGVLMCYDMTRYISFENLQEWYDIISLNVADPVYILVGGKADLEHEKRAVSAEDGEEFRKSHDLDYFIETSSKSGDNNRSIFETLARDIIKKKNIQI